MPRANNPNHGPHRVVTSGYKIDRAHYREVNENGTVLRDKQYKFIDFLLDPSLTKGSIKKWTEDNSVGYKTALDWKNKDRPFREEWKKRSDELATDPERIAAVVQAMYQAAISPVGTAKDRSLYMEYIKQYTPTSKTIVEDKSVTKLTDEELAEQLEQNATHLRAV